VVLDGQSGAVRHRLPWPSREGFEDYNHYCRNYLYIAYLDGQEPHLIVQRGTYGLIKMVAYNRELEQVWSWQAEPGTPYAGQAAHTAVAADVDGDGCDEIVYGSAVLDHDGTELWSRATGHPDNLHVAHILPDRPGLQIFYGLEPPHKQHGICVVHAATGELLWGYASPTRHIHGHGLAADFIAEEPGMELFTGEADGSARFLFSADGRLLASDLASWPLSMLAAYWDAGPTKALLDPAHGRLFAFPDKEYLRLGEEGRPLQVLAVLDLLGDWREEILVGLPGELRIYTTTIPALHRRVTLMQDRMYRTGAARWGMGYPCPPQESGIYLQPGRRRAGADFWEGIL
jgi:rhamnogalacturonan endolyase